MGINIIDIITILYGMLLTEIEISTGKVKELHELLNRVAKHNVTEVASDEIIKLIDEFVYLKFDSFDLEVRYSTGLNGIPRGRKLLVYGANTPFLRVFTRFIMDYGANHHLYIHRQSRDAASPYAVMNVEEIDGVIERHHTELVVLNIKSNFVSGFILSSPRLMKIAARVIKIKKQVLGRK